MLKILNKEDNFNQILKDNDEVIIAFTAPWCPTCVMYKPTFVEVAENSQKMFLSVNVDDFGEISTEWGIQSIPTTVFVKKDKEVNRVIGFINKDDLIKQSMV